MRRSSQACPRTPTGGRLGFTLLEVLGAVLVLGMLYSVLAEVAIQGLRAEGEGRRRLEASLLADELLAEIEATLASEADLPIGLSAEEDDPYLIELEVRPLALVGLLPPLALGEDAPLSNLAGTDPDENPIREIVLKISWSEGDRDLYVTRTTLAVATAGFGIPSAEGSAGAADGGAGPTGGGAAGDDTGGGSGAARKGSAHDAQLYQRNVKRSGQLPDILERRRGAHEWQDKTS